MCKLKLDVYNKTRSPVSPKIFLALLRQAQDVLVMDKRVAHGQLFFVELSLVGKKKITLLNALHHGKNHPTDVISLSYFEKKMPDSFLGEIFICIPYARRQAQKIGQTLEEELQFLFVHGLLHLFGYDHKKPREEKHMKLLTYRILGRK